MVKPKSDAQDASPLPTSRRLPAAERRQQILEAALPVFAGHGHNGAGTRELAAAAGVSEPILYRHFADKTELFCAVVALSGERLAAAPAAALHAAGGVAARLRALAEALPEWLVARRHELLVLGAAAAVEHDARVAKATTAALLSIGDALVAAMPARELRRGISRSTAGYLLLQLGLGAAQLHPVPLPALDHADYSKQVVQILLHGLARPST